VTPSPLARSVPLYVPSGPGTRASAVMVTSAWPPGGSVTAWGLTENIPAGAGS